MCLPEAREPVRVQRVPQVQRVLQELREPEQVQRVLQELREPEQVRQVQPEQPEQQESGCCRMLLTVTAAYEARTNTASDDQDYTDSGCNAKDPENFSY